LNDEQTAVLDDKVYLKDHYGRIRAITSDDEGNIYIATSNRDWKPQVGFPLKGDDRILKLSKVDFVPDSYLEKEKSGTRSLKSGKALYQAYCASCHMEGGEGVNRSIPPLIQTPWIQDGDKLLDVMLHGLKGKIVVDGLEYDEMMPAFNFLSNHEIAEIASYIRSNFGNNYTAIDSVQVETRKAFYRN